MVPEKTYDDLFGAATTVEQLMKLYGNCTTPSNLEEEGELSTNQVQRKYEMITRAKDRALANLK